MSFQNIIFITEVIKFLQKKTYYTHKCFFNSYKLYTHHIKHIVHFLCCTSILYITQKKKNRIGSIRYYYGEKPFDILCGKHLQKLRKFPSKTLTHTPYRKFKHSNIYWRHTLIILVELVGSIDIHLPLVPRVLHMVDSTYVYFFYMCTFHLDLLWQ